MIIVRARYIGYQNPKYQVGHLYNLYVSSMLFGYVRVGAEAGTPSYYSSIETFLSDWTDVEWQMSNREPGFWDKLSNWTIGGTV